MAAAKKTPGKAAAKKAAAARGEKAGKSKTIDFRGLELKLPAKLPGTLIFDLADIETGNDLRGTMEFLKSLVGPEQYQAIRNKVAEEQISFDEVEKVLVGLLEDIVGTSGLDLGE